MLAYKTSGHGENPEKIFFIKAFNLSWRYDSDDHTRFLLWFIKYRMNIINVINIHE